MTLYEKGRLLLSATAKAKVLLERAHKQHVGDNRRYMMIDEAEAVLRRALDVMRDVVVTGTPLQPGDAKEIGERWAEAKK